MSGKKKTKILLIEDSITLAMTYEGYLGKSGYDIHRCENGTQALAALSESTFQVVLLDLMLPDMSGLDILKNMHDNGIPGAVIIITAHGSVEFAVEAMRYGAFDFLEKPFNKERLTITVRNALDKARLTAMVDNIKLSARDSYEGFIGSSLPMQAVYRIIDSAASSKASIFITGESGTGKEVCAEALHRKSPRADGPFIALNCAAIPHDLMESEVFGHIKGAFTGANAAREGAASRADGGTLFMDEIAEMNLDLQAKLLRFIQTGSFQKVGGSRTETVDVRFISATNKDPLEEVKAGRFREDLYYRLHVIPLGLPALRERDDDILLIARYFLTTFSDEEGKNFSSFDAATSSVLKHYEWPGNVRELQNVIRNIVVLHDSDVVSVEMLPAPLDVGLSELAVERMPSVPTTVQPHVIRPLWMDEKDIIEQAIRSCDNNIPRAAALLEISASTIYRKIQTWKEMDETSAEV